MAGQEKGDLVIEVTAWEGLTRGKPANAVTSIKKPLVLKGHLIFLLSYNISHELNLF